MFPPKHNFQETGFTLERPHVACHPINQPLYPVAAKNTTRPIHSNHTNVILEILTYIQLVNFIEVTSLCICLYVCFVNFS